MITIACSDCGKPINLPVTEDQVSAWKSSGLLIQKSFPQLTDNERELLISGTCGECFDALFNQDAITETRAAFFKSEAVAEQFRKASANIIYKEK